MSADRPRVWLVDDSALEAERVKRLLQSGHEVEVYADGASMLERLSVERPPAILILDVGLPGISGLEVCQFVRSRFDETSVQILMLTCHVKNTTLVAALAAGANDYMTKPFDPVELLARVGVLLRTRQVFRRAAEAEQAREEAQRKVLAEQSRLQTLLTHAPTGIGVLEGPEHVVTFANPELTRLVGLECRSGTPITRASPLLGDLPLQSVLDHVYTSGEPIAVQALPLSASRSDVKGERERVVKLTFQPRRGASGDIVGVDLFAFDVTEQVLGQRKVEELLSIASHELKTPVTSIMLHLQVLQRTLERAPEQLGPDRLQAGLVVIDRQMRRQMRLVDDLLDVSRLVAGKLKLECEELEVNALAHEVAARFEEERQRTGSTLEVYVGAPVVAHLDRLRMDQILTNLLSNALKYGRGQPIEVWVTAVGRQRLRLTVRDHGIGIGAQHLGRVFERFERAVSERNYAGLGLGLWITRRIVESMRGTISVDSQLGVGSTFTVELPRSEAPGTTAPLLEADAAEVRA